MRLRATVLLAVLILAVLCLLVLGWRSSRRGTPYSAHEATSVAPQGASPAPTPLDPDAPAPDNRPTSLYAHNLLLRQGPNFRAYIPWVRGQLVRTQRSIVPSLDDSDSFVLSLQKGVLDIYLADLTGAFNSGSAQKPPFTNARFTIDKGEIHLHATVHKVIPLPIEVTGAFSPMPGGNVRLHISGIHVLKIPMGGLLGGLHITVADLIGSSGKPGLRMQGNDIIVEPATLLPPPHIVGNLTSVQPVMLQNGPGLEAIYGNAKNDKGKEQQWHDFLQLTDGTLSFGKITMRQVDLMLIDASTTDPWFDLDLSNYQAQLVNGVTRTTPQAGMQIFMPGRDQLPKGKAGATVTMEWLKDRKQPSPVTMPGK